MTEREYDILLDTLGDLNDTTPRIRISPSNPPKPEILFGLDTKLFEQSGDEVSYWDKIGQDGGWHGDEVETKSISLGGESKKRKRHNHAEGEECGCEAEEEVKEGAKGVERQALEEQLKKLNFEIYRGEHISQAAFDQANIASERYSSTIIARRARSRDVHSQLCLWSLGPHAVSLSRR